MQQDVFVVTILDLKEVGDKRICRQTMTELGLRRLMPRLKVELEELFKSGNAFP